MKIENSQQPSNVVADMPVKWAISSSVSEAALIALTRKEKAKTNMTIRTMLL